MSRFYWFLMDSIEHWVLVRPQSGLLCGAALMGHVFSEKTSLLRTKQKTIFQWPFITNEISCYQLEKALMKPASRTLWNFCGYPRALKWSSQSRPTTDFVRISHPQIPDQPSLFRLNFSDGWRVFYGWRALRQPCRESRQPCFMVDRAFGQMVDGAMLNLKVWISWPSVWYHLEIFRTNFSTSI